MLKNRFFEPINKTLDIPEREVVFFRDPFVCHIPYQPVADDLTISRALDPLLDRCLDLVVRYLFEEFQMFHGFLLIRIFVRVNFPLVFPAFFFSVRRLTLILAGIVNIAVLSDIVIYRVAVAFA